MSEVTTLKELLYFADEMYGDEPFVIENKKGSVAEKSYRQLRKDCDSLAVWIESEFNERVHAALVGSTSYEYLTAWFGIQCCGCVSVPLDTVNNAERISDEINRSDSQILFIDRNHEDDIEKLKQLCPAVKYIISIHGRCEGALCLDDIISENAGKKPKRSTKSDDLAAILFTSGTTGKSKGVMLSNGNLIDNTKCGGPDESFHGEKRMTVLPVHHIFCFTCDILCGLWYGRRLCINDSLMRIPKNMKFFQPNSVTFVPMIAMSLLNKLNQVYAKTNDRKAAVSEVLGDNLDIIYTGGAYLSPEIQKSYAEFGVEITQGYGMTECSPRICTGKRKSEAPDSVGIIVDGCEVKIVEGEIWVKSKSVMMGYYKNPEETEKSLTPDGWLRTGDLGYKDDRGYLYITGRKKNLIILSNGENVSPEELENQFSCFTPVKEIIVYAKEGQITAEVYPNPDYISDDISAEIQKKIDEVNDTFPPAKRIVKMIIRDTEFEKTTSKKIIRPSF